jgi:hypothetical protein
LAETMAKSSDELANNQDKMDHLNDVKAKLEKTLDQMDGALESKFRFALIKILCNLTNILRTKC